MSQSCIHSLSPRGEGGGEGVSATGATAAFNPLIPTVSPRGEGAIPRRNFSGLANASFWRREHHA